MDSKIQVKFTSGMPYNGRVYYQPLFYFAENYRQMVKQNSGKEIESKKRDNDLVILGEPKLEVGTFMNISGKDTRISFSLNQVDNIFVFKLNRCRIHI
jgi:hypothetical protein